MICKLIACRASKIIVGMECPQSSSLTSFGQILDQFDPKSDYCNCKCQRNTSFEETPIFKKVLVSKVKLQEQIIHIEHKNVTF